MDMLRITDLHKRFGDKEVLCGLNLTVPEHIRIYRQKRCRKNNHNENDTWSSESRFG